MISQIKYKTERDYVSGFVDEIEVIQVYFDERGIRVGSSSCLPTDINLAKYYIEVMEDVIKRAEMEFKLKEK